MASSQIKLRELQKHNQIDPTRGYADGDHVKLI
jgi:hypothetical protein